MFPKAMFFFVLLLLHLQKLRASSGDDFVFNGFSNANLSLDGIASITSSGLLEMTNTTLNMQAHAFHPIPLSFKSAAGKILSFSTTFVFAIVSEIPNLSGQGLAFVISPTTDFSATAKTPSQYLGLFTQKNNGNSTNHIFAVELDTIQNPEFQDINDNHVGIDINSLDSNNSTAAGYYEDSTGLLKNLTLISGEEMQVWIDFNSEKMQLDVTLSPAQMNKPKKPLLSSTLNLSSLMQDTMYIGFSSADGPFRTHHYVVGWSFKMNGVAQPLDYTKLPVLPVTKSKGYRKLNLMENIQRVFLS